MSYFILEGKTLVPVNVREWGEWFEQADRVLASDYTLDGTHVSTVFLGLDHSFGLGPPEVFETMIFGGPHDQSCWRYSTYDAAVAGHRHAVLVAKLLVPNDG